MATGTVAISIAELRVLTDLKFFYLIAEEISMNGRKGSYGSKVVMSVQGALPIAVLIALLKTFVTLSGS